MGHNKLNAHFEMQIRHQDTEGRQVELLADAGRGTLTIAVYTSSFTGNLLISRLMLTRPDHEQTARMAGDARRREPREGITAP